LAYTIKRAFLAAFFYAALAGQVLSAQTTLRVTVIPTVRIYIAPIEGGTPEEREYFMNSMEMEFTGAAYEMAETAEESDFIVNLVISREEPDPEPEPEYGGTGPSNFVTLSLSETGSGREIVSLSFEYQEVSEMDVWNLYMITQAMANAPIIRLPPGAELYAAPEGGPPRKADFKRAFYLGLRAGGVFGTATFQNFGGYEGGLGRGFAGEGAVLAEWHFFRFLSIQAEAVFVYDTFKGAKEVREGEEIVRTAETFQFFTLAIPLLVKTPVELGPVTVSPFAGVYYLMFLMPGLFGGEEDRPYRTDPPLGISLGIEAGLSLGPGKLFGSLRFDQNVGMTTGGQEGPLYSQNRVGLSIGYKFLLGKRRDGGAAGTGGG
jgi:hypothetical protein